MNTQKILNLYNDNISINKISDYLGISRYYVYKTLNENEVHLRGINKIKIKNENIFEKIDTHEKAYFLGLLLADGCNYANKTILQLHIQDKDIIQKLIDFIGYEGSLNINGSKSTLVINSKKITSDLEKFEFLPRKTHSLKFPNINHNMFNSLILGYLDGDGSISFSKNKAQVSFTGNSDMIIPIKNILNNIGVNSYVTKRHKDRDDNIITIIISGNNQVVRLLDWIYKDSEYFFERKKSKYFKILEFLKNKENRKKEKEIEINNKINQTKMEMELKKQEIIRLYSEGYSIKRISKSISISDDKVKNVLLENNIEIRDRLFYEEYRKERYNLIKNEIKFNKSGKKILCVELNITFDTIKEAKKIKGGNINIHRALKDGSKAGGYHWIYL